MFKKITITLIPLIIAAGIAIGGRTIIRVNVIDSQLYETKKKIEILERIQKDISGHLIEIKNDVKWIKEKTK